jgi:2'-5' RNA ligase
VNSDGVHVTLKFLGEVPVRQLPAIKLAIQEAVVGHQPFELELSNIGTFGGREGCGSCGWAWRGCAAPGGASAGGKRGAGGCGLRARAPAFRPHLTLGRVRDEVSTRQRAEIEVAVGKMEVPVSSWRTTQVSLMRSRLTVTGAQYEALATFPLRLNQPQ